jgi:anthranilate synthase
MKIQLFSSALLVTTSAAFAPMGWLQRRSSPPAAAALLQMSTTPDYNGVHVAKTGGRGANTASQQALQQELSLGAPPARPKGGHFMTKGGIQVTSNVEPVFFSRSAASGSAAAIEELVDKLDKQRGVLLASSYEFPGRYARWSLGFVDPPLEVSGKGNKCTIRALNTRGKILLPAIQSAMEQLKVDGVLQKIDVRFDAQEGTGADIDRMASQIDVLVVPPSAVGSFSEEERSRQVSENH